jgi:hypothetical protein
MITTLSANSRPIYLGELQIEEFSYLSKKGSGILKRNYFYTFPLYFSSTTGYFSTATQEFFTVCGYTNLADKFYMNMEIAMQSIALRVFENGCPL